jgi:phage-related protein
MNIIYQCLAFDDRRSIRSDARGIHMTEGKTGRRPLFWEGSAKRDFKHFPEAVQKDMGVALFIVQLGGTPPSAKPWKGLGSGVHELVEDHRGDTYRAVYMVRIAGRVHVLHAFQKKSKSGIKTPRADIELIETRLKAALGGYRNERE